MVSLRCKMVVKEECQKLGLPYLAVNLGELILAEAITSGKREILKTTLVKYGLELLEDKKAILIERIKNIIVQMVHYDDEYPKTNFSIFISTQLNYDYTYLANIFSETQCTTIEHFIILHKIEKAKALISYGELNLTEIAWKLHYSSVSHLSTQFKKITGITPSCFKTLKRKKFCQLEDIGPKLIA